MPDIAHTGPRIAIACQGGGSQTAFTAGVLQVLLREAAGRFVISQISGTSGGALCALLAWDGLVRQHAGTWTVAQTIERLEAFWQDNTAQLPGEIAWNGLVVNSARLQGNGLLPEFRTTPYSPQAVFTTRLLETLAPRREFVDLEYLLSKHVAFDQLIQGSGVRPRLLIGAVAVRKGDFKAFDSWRGEISVEAALASAALPQTFQAVRIGDEVYWDGLFSQNPPVREFVSGVEPDQKPEQIWVIRINPQERAREPTTVADIEDRRNELAGNLSLNQELRSIRTFNELIAKKLLNDPTKRQISIHEFAMADTVSAGLDPASKLDRSREHIMGLMAHGRERAGAMLEEILGAKGADDRFQG
ncbi:MAG: patatin-like phospholipase family protein [Chloroflexi bacterium]|nr:patatin-like phospholipase family protein [Chloroflexota bacterium]